MAALLELLLLVAVLVGAGAVLRRTARGPGGGPSPALAPAQWAPHVAVADGTNDTVVTVRRGAESLEVARIAGDDPRWHDRLLDARAEAALRASALNAPD